MRRPAAETAWIGADIESNVGKAATRQVMQSVSAALHVRDARPAQ